MRYIFSTLLISLVLIPNIFANDKDYLDSRAATGVGNSCGKHILMKMWTGERKKLTNQEILDRCIKCTESEVKYQKIAVNACLSKHDLHLK